MTQTSCVFRAQIKTLNACSLSLSLPLFTAAPVLHCFSKSQSKNCDKCKLTVHNIPFPIACSALSVFLSQLKKCLMLIHWDFQIMGQPGCGFRCTVAFKTRERRWGLERVCCLKTAFNILSIKHLKRLLKNSLGRQHKMFWSAWRTKSWPFNVWKEKQVRE